MKFDNLPDQWKTLRNQSQAELNSLPVLTSEDYAQSRQQDLDDDIQMLDKLIEDFIRGI